MREDQVRKEVMNLDESKDTAIGNVSTDISKPILNIHLPLTSNSINLCIKKDFFPEKLKLAEVSPIFKRKDDLEKQCHRPVSVLPHVSKVFERIIYHQLNDYMRDK